MKGLLAILLVFSAAFSQTPTAKKVRAAGDNGQEYLAARTAEKAGRMGEAMAGFERIADNRTDLSPFASARMSRAARSTGNLLLERILLMRTLPSAGDPAVRVRLARNAMERENNSEAVTLLLSGKPGDPANRDDQALLGEAYLRSGRGEIAEAIFTRLENEANSAQPDNAAITAVRGLDRIGNPGSDEERLKRAAIYQANRDFEAARAHLRTVIDASPAGPLAADCAMRIGRGYGQAGDYTEAINWYERVLERYPALPPAKDALLQAASAYGRVGKSKEAFNRYKRFIDLYPSDEKLERAYLNIVDIYRDQGEAQEALKWCAKTEERFRGTAAEAVAIFAEARIHISKDDWPSALNALDRLRSFPDLGGTTPGGTDVLEVKFLRAFVMEQQARYAEAIEGYLAVPSGRADYYGWHADDRLRELSKNPASRGFIDQTIGSLSAQLKAGDVETRRSSALSVLRMSDHPDVRAGALDVLKGIYKPVSIPAPVISDDPAAVKLLKMGMVDDAYPYAYRSVSMAEPAFRKVAADYPVDLLPRESLRQLYPAAFEFEILREAKRVKVDPRFVLAIMRQESRFDPRAHSTASARGLMQLIMSTATTAAGKIGRGDIAEDELLDAGFSIRLGTQHLSDLFRTFPEQPEAVAAAYNAGAENAQRWKGRANSGLAERYVPETMFAQTKDYVAKVMSNYRMYQYLYDDELRPR